MAPERETETDAESAAEIAWILARSRTIAVVGLSPRPERDSHRVAAYLGRAGYRIVPVHPTADRVLGERVYLSLDDVPGKIDLVDVFRRSEEVLPVAEAALRRGVPAFWMQLGVRNAEAARLLCDAGVRVVQDRCIAVEHARIVRVAPPPHPLPG